MTSLGESIQPAEKAFALDSMESVAGSLLLIAVSFYLISWKARFFLVCLAFEEAVLAALESPGWFST